MVKIGGVQWVGASKRIVNLGFAGLATLEAGSPFAARLQTALTSLVNLECSLHLQFALVEVVRVQVEVVAALRGCLAELTAS